MWRLHHDTLPLHLLSLLIYPASLKKKFELKLLR